MQVAAFPKTSSGNGQVLVNNGMSIAANTANLPAAAAWVNFFTNDPQGVTAYAFGQLQFRFRSFFFVLMLLTIMLPYQVLIIPQYIPYLHFGWLNTYLPLVVPRFLGVDAFFVFLMVQFIRGLPRELDEAAIYVCA